MRLPLRWDVLLFPFAKCGRAAKRASQTRGADVTTEQFRRLALSFPETVEGEHMDHPDFRVGGKIFATISPDPKWGMVKLTPEQQVEFMRAEPEVFKPCAGAWGRRGATNVRLRAAKRATLRRAMAAAWCNTAPKELARQFETEFK
jgi:hypothetical protein